MCENCKITPRIYYSKRKWKSRIFCYERVWKKQLTSEKISDHNYENMKNNKHFLGKKSIEQHPSFFIFFFFFLAIRRKTFVKYKKNRASRYFSIAMKKKRQWEPVERNLSSRNGTRKNLVSPDFVEREITGISISGSEFLPVDEKDIFHAPDWYARYFLAKLRITKYVFISYATIDALNVSRVYPRYLFPSQHVKYNIEYLLLSYKNRTRRFSGIKFTPSPDHTLRNTKGIDSIKLLSTR